jgi:hypothetical protein
MEFVNITLPHPPQRVIPPASSQKRCLRLAERRLSLMASLAASTSSRGMPESGTGTAIHSLWGYVSHTGPPATPHCGGPFATNPLRAGAWLRNLPGPLPIHPPSEYPNSRKSTCRILHRAVELPPKWRKSPLSRP